MSKINISTFLGKTIIKVSGGHKGSEEIIFEMSDGTSYRMFHWQDCCEHVSVEDVDGDLQELIGNQILLAEEVSNSSENTSDYDSCTWTFYKLSTVKASCTIRWLGISNGYYSESVDIVQL